MVPITAMPPFPWQSSYWLGFCNKVKAKRLPHAMLVCGVDGIGIELLAQAMTRYLLCHTPIEDLACGRCRGCQLYEAGTHPDLKQLSKEEKSAFIKVDQVRDCVEFVGKTPHFPHYKVVVIESAETMNINAANALLKSLEEPAGQTIFILVTTRVNAILPTIRSRCQKASLPVPALEDGLAWLREEQIDSPEEWLALAGGAPVLARQWAQGAYASERREVVDSILGIFETRHSTLFAANIWAKLDFELLIAVQISLMDGILRAKLGLEQYEQSLQECQQFFEILEPPLLFKMRDKLLTKLAQWRSNNNLNPTMLCEELAMDWGALVQMASRAQRVS